MSWLHHIISGVIACCFGIISFDFWRSLVQEMRQGKVHDLRERVAGLVVFCSLAVTSLWDAIASPEPGTTGEYVRQGLVILAVAAFIYSGVIVWHKRRKAQQTMR